MGVNPRAYFPAWFIPMIAAVIPTKPMVKLGYTKREFLALKAIGS